MRNAVKYLESKLTFPIVMLTIIVIIGVLLRFNNIPYRYGFDYDAVRDALIALHGAQTLSLPLHGPPSALGSFHFGPWYYFQLILFQLFFPFQYAAWYSVTLISVVGIICMYGLGKKIADWKLGLILSLLTAISPSLITSGTGLSNPNMIITLTAASLWLFATMVKEKKNLVYGILLGFLIGLAINYHYQALTLLLIFPVLLLIQSHNRLKNIIAESVGILIACIPLLIFNYMNDWHTVRGLLFYMVEGKNAVYIPNSWTIYLRDFWPTFWSNTFGLPVLFGLMLGIFSVSILSIGVIKKNLNVTIISILIMFFIQFVYLRYFSSSREIYYLYFLQPFIICIVGIAVWQLGKIKFGTALAIMLLTLITIFALPKSLETARSPESYRMFTADIEQLVKEYPNQKFTVYDCGSIEKNNSHAYAFLLSHTGLLTQEGVKILFEDETCQVDRKVLMSDDVKELKIKRDVDTHKKKILILDSNSHKDVIKAGWQEISPESVYTRELL